jgi:SAM-dependent methyltransferase
MSHSKPHAAGEPSPWIARWMTLLPPGARVLDLACGSGRHALSAVRKGHRVLAVDRDADALARLRAESASALDETSQGRLELRMLDLEQGPWTLPPGSFDAVIVANYLFRPRFALACGLLAPGGLLIYETFARGNEAWGRPSNPDFLLQQGELIARCQAGGLAVIAYESGYVSDPKPAVVQRICAARPSPGSAKLAVLATDPPTDLP